MVQLRGGGSEERCRAKGKWEERGTQGRERQGSVRRLRLNTCGRGWVRGKGRGWEGQRGEVRGVLGRALKVGTSSSLYQGLRKGFSSWQLAWRLHSIIVRKAIT